MENKIKKAFFIIRNMDSNLRKNLQTDKGQIAVAKRHDISVAQVAEAYCVNKGVVPICGCRKPNQVKELAEAVGVKLTSGEIRKLEEAADHSGAKVLGHDLFRFAVLKATPHKAHLTALH